MTDENNNNSETDESSSVGRLHRLKPSGTIGSVSPYVWFGGLFGLLVLAVLGGIQYGYIDPSITLAVEGTLTFNLGWAVELLVGLLIIVFGLLNLVMLARLAGVGFLNSVLAIVVNVLDGFSKDDIEL